MSCEEVQERLLEGAGAIDDATRTHLETCAVCRAVDDARGVSGAPSGDFAALFAAVEADQARERGPLGWLRARPTWARRCIIAGVGLLTALFGLLAMRRPDFDVYPMGRFAIEVGVMAVAMTVGVAMAVRSRLELPSGRTASLWVVLAVLIPVVFALLPEAHTGHPASAMGVGDDFLPRAMGCLIWGTLMGAPTAVIAFLARRDQRGEPRRDMLLAGAAGLAGVVTIETHCPITDGTHLLVGHATIVVVVLAVVAFAGWLGGRIRRQRSR